MAVLKIHLPSEELSAITRAAERLGLKPERLAYAAIDRLMLQLNDAEVRAELARLEAEWSRSLARWSDSARSVHIYESQPDDQSARSPYLRLDEW